MALPNDWRIHTHLSEEMAKALVKARSEAYGGEPEPSGINITEEGVTMTPEAAFDELYVHNRVLWENVVDALIDIAQEKFFEFHNVDPDDDECDYYLNNGIVTDETTISVVR